MNKKLISLAILSIIVFGSLASVYGYQEYIYRWMDDGESETHGGCGHEEEGTTESTAGTLTITLETAGTINPYDEIEISFDILNFTEALIDAHFTNSSRSGESWRVTHGIPGYRGDNSLFLMNNSHQFINRGESLDEYGSMIDDNDASYILYAPKAAGVYTLVVVAMGALNQTDLEAYNITYIEGSIDITVVAPAENGGGGGGSTIPGFITAVMLSSVGVAILAVVLTVRRKRRILK